MTTLALVPAAAPMPVAFPGAEEMTAMRNMAALMAQSNIVPDSFRNNPANIIVALLTARGMGIDPMVALQKGYVINGRFDVEVTVKLGVVMSRVPDFEYEVDVDDARAIVTGGRRGRKHHSVTFTYQQAVDAGLVAKKGDVWKNYRQDMLTYRALGRLLKLTCAFALYNMPLSLDEADAEVVADNVGLASSPAATSLIAGPSATSSAKQAAVGGPTPSAPADSAPLPFVHTPGDWLGRLCEAIRAHYSVKAEVPAGAPARTKWLQAANKDGKVLRLLNHFYTMQNPPQPEVGAWIAVPPLDYERIALWIEAVVAKRAGGAGGEGPQEGRSGRTEATPAPVKSEAVVLPTDPAPSPDGVEVALPPGFDGEEEDGGPMLPPPVAGPEALAAKGLLHLLTILDALRMETKGQRKFYTLSGTTKRPVLIDGPILLACGFTAADGKTPLAQWLDDLSKQPGPWMAVCSAVREECVAANVRYL
jgi:hypothetical protein